MSKQTSFRRPTVKERNELMKDVHILKGNMAKLHLEIATLQADLKIRSLDLLRFKYEIEELRTDKAIAQSTISDLRCLVNKLDIEARAARAYINALIGGNE